MWASLQILGFAIVISTKIQLHATRATTNLCSCLKQVAHDIQLHAILRTQHVYTMLIYMFIHTYQSKSPIKHCLECHSIKIGLGHNSIKPL
jgi:hypothetical protein